MPEGESDPFDLADTWESTLEGRSTRDRVYEVAIQLSEPTRVTDVAARADCAKETARDHLRWLAEAGIVQQDTENPDTFSRNESYFRWKRINRLRRETTREERTERLEELTRQERAFKNRYGVEGPEEMDALDHVDYDDVERVWMEISEWHTLRQRIRDLELVRQDRGGEAFA